MECYPRPRRYIALQDEGRGEIVQVVTCHVSCFMGLVWGAGFAVLSPVAESMQKPVSE